MINLKKIERNFLSNLKSLDEINSFGDDLTNLTLEFLSDLESQNNESEGFLPYKEKLSRTIEQIEQIKSNNPDIKKKYEIIFNQSVVLIVSSFEIFISELIVELANNVPEILKWKDKEKMLIDPTDYYYSNLNFGQIVFKHLKSKFIFSDIKSVLDFFDQYVEKKLNIKKIKDDLILFQSIRNIIVHNLSKIDENFIKRLLNTKYKNKHECNINSKINLKKTDYDKAKKAYSNFVSEIMKVCREKICESLGEELIIE